MQAPLLLQQRTIISLCDFSGNWSKPYRDAGYNVVQVDLKHGHDVRMYQHYSTAQHSTAQHSTAQHSTAQHSYVHGILAAPPCTAFAGSGAQYWPEKDKDGRTLEGLALVDACMRIVLAHRQTLAWWALENPVGRLRRWLGAPTLSFNPCDYGDPYTKKTLLWGEFNAPVKNPVEPIRVCSQGSWLQKLGGSSEKTKELRSMTPMGFANAFFAANP